MATITGSDHGKTDIQRLKGVGPRLAERLSKINIHSIHDLLVHLPLRYENRTRIHPIGSLRSGDHAVIEGKIQLTEIKFARKRMLLCHLQDGTGSITLRFFHFSSAQQQSLARGQTIRCYGEVRRSGKHLEMIHPEYNISDTITPQPVDETLTPIYPVTEGLHQLSMRNLLRNALTIIEQDKIHIPEYLPDVIREKLQLVEFKEAILYLHQPPPDVSVAQLEQGQHPMQRRLAFEEILAHILSLKQLREKVQTHPAETLYINPKLEQQFLAALPFTLTAAQQRVFEAIKSDLGKPVPMQRLLQGDVGSGKTVVAALAALCAVSSNKQVAIMAPTEILAEQHYQNFKLWFEPLGFTITWLTGKLKAAERKSALSQILSGDADIVIGTHALFQDQVNFNNLGLVIIDEQHRFGVHQRLALLKKGSTKNNQHEQISEHTSELAPHQLIMTATPIPRTLSMTVYADLDCSIIDELPPGRQKIETVVLPVSRRADVVQRIEGACHEGRQVYWVCTLIEESEVLQCQAAEDAFTELSAAITDFKLGLIHGRMKPQQKEHIMRAFKSGEIQILVATTVIEVGVDVPNASLMVIENAERLGLSQLHQLRGRVGRGSIASACVLMYHGNLSQMARERLAIMRETNDGFKIAQKDLELRGPGEVLGTRQTGLQQYSIAQLPRDADMLPEITELASSLLKHNPSSVAGLINRWIGNSKYFADV